MSVLTKKGYKAYVTYIAVRNHFTSDYDFFFYHGKVPNATEQAYAKHKAKSIFAVLASRVDEADLAEYLACNFAYTPTELWVNDFLDPKAKINFEKYSKYKESSTYIFSQELSTLDIREAIKVPENGTYPILLKRYMMGELSLETLVILNSFIKFLPIWNEKITDQFLWPMRYNRIKKFIPFVKFDRARCANVLKKKYPAKPDTSYINNA